MLYLVDGYNVTHRDPATGSLSLLEQREALVARLRVRGRDLLGSGRIVVVFDGEGGPGLSTGGGVPVEIVYAHARSADDEIVRIAATSKDSVVIVSSDRGLMERAQAHAGAQARSARLVMLLRGGRQGEQAQDELARVDRTRRRPAERRRTRSRASSRICGSDGDE